MTVLEQNAFLPLTLPPLWVLEFQSGQNPQFLRLCGCICWKTVHNLSFGDAATFVVAHSDAVSMWRCRGVVENLQHGTADYVTRIPIFG